MLEEMKTESTDNNYDNDSAASPNIKDSILEETEMESVDQNTDTCTDRNEVFCRHSPQCILRQPRPPPLPSVTHIRNIVSNYQEHIMSKQGVPAQYGGHERCLNMSPSKNYGCDDCIWFKWHDQLHGYPDINPGDFRKHLESL